MLFCYPQLSTWDTRSLPKACSLQKRRSELLTRLQLPLINISQLKSFLGLINYYGKFLPNLSNTLAPLYKLLQKNTAWQWGPEQQKAFQTAKKSLTSDCLLVHFGPSKGLLLACDASPYGIGAVLSHQMENRQERPIAFSSRTLAPAYNYTIQFK